MRPWMFVTLLAITGCEAKVGYCAGEVRAEDQGQGITDPAFYNPDLVGKSVCYVDTVSEDWCAERNGTFGDMDAYEEGGAAFCAEQGFPADCGGGLFMATPEDCPS